VGYFVFAYQMVKARKEGVSIFDVRLMSNPLNLVFRPSLLSPQGLIARRRFIISFISFIVSLVTIILLFQRCGSKTD
jgi:hypothetical protein